MSKTRYCIFACILLLGDTLRGNSIENYWSTLTQLITTHKKVTTLVAIGTIIYLAYPFFRSTKNINKRKNDQLAEEKNASSPPSRLERVGEGLLYSIVSAYIGAQIQNNFIHQTRNFNTQANDLITAYNPEELDSFKDYIGEFDQEEQFHLEYLSNVDKLPEKFRKGRKLMLTGKPGTGKTAFAIEFARRSKSRLLKVSTSSLNTGWFGDGAGIVKAVFKRIKEEADLYDRLVVFFDEIDSIGSRDGELSSSSGQSQRLTINMILEKLNEPLAPNTVILAATNKIEDVDGALSRPGRFDATIKKELPDRKKRGEYWTEKEKDPYYALLQKIDLENVLKDTNQFSQADLELLCDDTVRRYYIQHLTPQEAYATTLEGLKTKKELDSKKSKIQEREEREKKHLEISEEQLSYAKTHKLDPRYWLSQVWELLN